MKKTSKISLTEFDVATCSSDLQMLKAYIPYADEKQQYIIAIFVRISELMETLEFYKNMKGPSPLCRKKHDIEHIVKDMSEYCPEKDAQILNMISQFGSFEEMYKLYSTMSSAENSKASDSSDIISGFLSKEQRQKYDQYKKLLNF